MENNTYHPFIDKNSIFYKTISNKYPNNFLKRMEYYKLYKERNIENLRNKFNNDYYDFKVKTNQSSLNILKFKNDGKLKNVYERLYNENEIIEKKNNNNNNNENEEFYDNSRQQKNNYNEINSHNYDSHKSNNNEYEKYQNIIKEIDKKKNIKYDNNEAFERLYKNDYNFHKSKENENNNNQNDDKCKFHHDIISFDELFKIRKKELEKENINIDKYKNKEEFKSLFDSSENSIKSEYKIIEYSEKEKWKNKFLKENQLIIELYEYIYDNYHYLKEINFYDENICESFERFQNFRGKSYISDPTNAKSSYENY